MGCECMKYVNHGREYLHLCPACREALELGRALKNFLKKHGDTLLLRKNYQDRFVAEADIWFGDMDSQEYGRGDTPLEALRDGVTPHLV